MVLRTSGISNLHILLAAVLAAALVPALALAQNNGSGNESGQNGMNGGNETANRTITILMDDEGAQYFFLVDNGTERNPTIQVQPGETVRFHVKNVGNVIHNFHILAPVNAAWPGVNAYANATEEGNLTVTFPDQDMMIEYQCDVPGHRQGGMWGRIQVGEPEDAQGGDGAGTPAPGLPAALAAVAAAMLALRRRS